MELYVNGAHAKCKGFVSQTYGDTNTVASYNRYHAAYMGFDGCLAKEAALHELLEKAKKKTQDYRHQYSEGWNKATPFEDAVWVFIDELRTLRFAYVLHFFAQEDVWPEAEFVGFLRKDFQTAMEGLENLLRLSEFTHAHKDQVKKATNLVRLKSNPLTSVGREGFATNAEFYRLPGKQVAPSSTILTTILGAPDQKGGKRGFWKN